MEKCLEKCCIWKKLNDFLDRLDKHPFWKTTVRVILFEVVVLGLFFINIYLMDWILSNISPNLNYFNETTDNGLLVSFASAIASFSILAVSFLIKSSSDDKRSEN